MQTQTQKKRTENGDYRLITLVAITPSPTNTRRSFDSEKVAQLGAGIKEKGVLQPILVQMNPLAPSRFQIERTTVNDFDDNTFDTEIDHVFISWVAALILMHKREAVNFRNIARKLIRLTLSA